ncbi:hypothetical protein [Halopelagius longus]|uniref:Uncharacterized protein n=1 Tax=Halopelagius longus TaxID=1236180 RepID=A0A1H1GIJ9_9EURY|nr:hypothetical protein [Halopelagius longus]RDI69724.1 hypothetical protein DWB78_18310 [Halopelagius longus]SDR12949.1 hypothetical protein SAMN05216278_3691 [Halopelagius longus]
MTYDPEDTSKGDEYRHPDGTREVVFALADGRVLTVKEYPDDESFDDGVADATYVGVEDDIADLPDASSFEVDGAEE